MSFCRITGRSRGLPKPNYFPLLAPISPADAKRCCRITGKSYGLPSHHYIPVLLTARSSKAKCKITNVSGELGPHHYSPEINYGNRKHDVLPDYRYIFPVLDGSTEAQKCLIELLLGKQVTEEKRYVYTVQERRCSLVFSAQMEAAVRDGDVRDVMLAKDSDTVLIKTKQGRSVSMDFKDFTEDVEMFEGEGPNAEVLKQREIEEMEEQKKKRKRAAGLSSMKKIFETKEKLAEVQEIEEETLRQVRKAKKAKLDGHEKHDIKTFSYNNYDTQHMQSKTSIVMCRGEWRDQLHPLIEYWDWEDFEKEVVDEQVIPKITTLPIPVKITPYRCEAELYEVDHNISEVSTTLESVPCVNPLKTIKTRPSQTVLSAVKEITKERLLETMDVTEKLINNDKVDMLPTMETLPEVVKNIKKGKREKVAKITGLTLDINKAKTFIPGQVVNTPQGPLFVPGQTLDTPTGPLFVPGLSVNTPAGPSLIPGHIVTNENTNEPFFLAGQVLQTANGEEFVCGQTMKTKDDVHRFVEGQTVLADDGFKFVPGKIVSSGTEEVFVPGQTILTPEGVQFIPGQTITEDFGVTFTPGQNAKIANEWQFIPGQTVQQDNELQFVPGATIATPNGLKFVPGQTLNINGESCFIPGITKSTESGLEFVPGTTVETVDGPKFIEGQIVNTDRGDRFMPGKTIVQANGHVEFSVAKSVEDISFSESAPMGLPIDIKTCSISEESLYVFGHMVQTASGIEFYPGSRMPKQAGKVVPGRLVKNEANESRFVPGTMVEGIFVPGQIVYTENGEQFVPGQVVETADGPKFVPGQVVNTKSGPKFVPGQTIHTIDGPRFVPGQIIETKAGPTFIPGQVIYTEDEGSRFVPGQVVDTEEGPRFVPGRVVETDDHGVTFVPGQIVQTPEGLKFVAPDLTEGEEGLEFSVQSFVVTPEELKLLKVKTNPNDTTSTKGELTIDRNMLRQLSEAGMSIGRQVPADLPAISVLLNQTRNAEALKAFVTDFGLKDEVANQLMDVIAHIIEMSAHLKSEISDNRKSDDSSLDSKKSRNSKKRMEMQEQNGTEENGQNAQQEHVKNSIAAAVLAALVTAEQFEEVNNNISKEKYQLILKSIDTILGKSIDENLVSAMFEILQKEEDKEILCEEILENSSEPKVELIKIAVNRALHKHSITEEDIIQKFGDFLSIENEVLGPAFKNISKNDTSLLHHVLGRISDSISFIKTDHEATETLQKAIVSAVQDSSTKELEGIINEGNKENIKELIVQSVGLAKVLGLRDVVTNLLSVINDEDCMAKIAEDVTSLNILKRLTVMRKLADKTPSLHSALRKLETDPTLARTDPNLRDLVRESAALMIVPEEDLMTSEDVPISLLQPENSLAMEEFLYQRKKHRGALLIMKKGLQAVVPREASRAVLTGQIAYTVLDESGIRHFEPLHVFSALKLSQPTVNRFSMYTCLGGGDKDKNDDLETFTGYCNISNNQRITKLGGWTNRRYSGVLLDRENTRSRISSYDSTPSYKGYSSRSLSRSRSSCSSGRSPSKVEDVVVATADYTAAAEDEVSLKAGDIVEVLDTKSALGSKCPTDPTLDVTTQLLDTSAAKHKLAVRPKKKHPKGKKKDGQRWLVRVIDDVQGGELRTRQGYVPASILEEKQSLERDQTSLAARRQAVVRELIETEEEFGRDMQQVVSRYMKPMDKATTPKPVFDSRELLFSNFKQICEFHNTVLLEGIKYYAGEPRMLGRALLRMEREFDKHVAYCRDEPRAHHLLTNEPTISKYFQNLANKLGDDKGLTEHLKLPIQRINDYQLLLKELVKYSQRLGEDCADLQKALELFLGVPSRATDNKFLASIEGYRGNIYKLGRLLTHDWFTVTDLDGKAKERYLFLFKARILISKVKRIADDRSVFDLKEIIKLPEVEVKDTGEQLKFELHLKNPSRILTLAAHKEQVKTNWLAEIRKYASDVLALAEHAADDLQVLLPPEEQPTEPEKLEESKEKVEGKKEKPEENIKKREREETEAEERQEKKSRVVDIEERVLTREESLQQTQAKRKASLEAQVAKKVAKTEIVEVSAISEIKEASTVSVQKSEVTAGLGSKSVTVESSKVETSQSITEQTVGTSKASAKAKTQISIQALGQKATVQSSEQKLEATESSTVQLSSQSVTSSSTAKQTAVTEQKVNHISESESTKPVQNCIDSKKESKVGSGAEVLEQVVNNDQTAAEENDEMSSRYSRTSRLSGEYTSSSRKLSGGGRYESSSTYDSTGLSSYTSRRESGSRIESGSGKYEIGGGLEGSASSRYESKYSTSSRLEGGAKYGIESGYESKTEGSKYGIEYDSSGKRDSIATKYGIDSKESKIESSKYSEYDTGSKLDSIASKYGIESTKETKVDTSSKIDSIASKYGIERRESKLESEYDAESKIDSIAKKYGKQESIEGKIEGRSSTISSKYSIETTLDGSNIDGVTSKVESKYESSTGGGASYETKKSKTAISNGSLSSERQSSKSMSKSEFKSGRPIFTTTLEGQNIELTAEERKERNALNAPYFEVALKDTEILQNTYLRFMIRVKGNPNPDVKFYRDDKEIFSTSESDRISIVRTRADKGCYELVIPDVTPADAGKYFCKAVNIYGEVTSEANVSVVDDKNIFFELPPGGEGLLAKGEKPQFTWKRDGQSFDPEERFKVLFGDDEDSLALVFQHVKPEDAGLYTCVAKTSTGSISCSAELTVQGAVHELHREPEKPKLVIEHREAIVSAGASAMLELQCKGYPKPNIVFKHDGKVVEADTRHKFLYEDEESMSLVIKNVTNSDAGEYHVTASNELGEDTTIMNLVVKQPPKIKKVDNQSCMVGSTHTVTIEVEGTPAPDVSFYKDGVQIKSSERIQIIKETEYIYKIIIKDAKLTDTGSYSVVAKNEVNQCSDFWQWHVTSPPRVIKKIGETKVCEQKERVTFTVETESEPAPTVKWFKNKVEVTESSTIKISTSGSAHSLVISSAAKSDAGEYSCEIRNIHGSASDSCLLNVRCAPSFTQTLRDTTATEGSLDVQFTVDVEAYPQPTIRWYQGDVEITEKKSVFTRVDSGSSHKLILKEVSAELAGTYCCKVSNDLGADSCQATFTVNRKPRITKSLVDMTVDVGQTLKLDVEVEGCPEPKVTWYKDGKEVQTDARIKIERDTKRLENYHLTVTLIKEEDGGEYEVRAENEFGSVSSRSTVTVHTKEVHSRISKQEIIENEVDEGSKRKSVEDNEDKIETQTAKRIQAEVVEEKSFWDDDDDGKAKKLSTEDIIEKKSFKAQKSVTEAEVVEEKSFWDDQDDGKAKKTITEDVEQKKSYKAQKSVKEEAEEKSFWDDQEDGKAKKPITEEVEQKKSYKAQKSVKEEAEEKSFWIDEGDGKPKKISAEDVEQKKTYKAQKSVKEEAEEKSFWDDQDEGKAKKVGTEDQTKPYKAQKSVTEAEVAEEKSFWDQDEGKAKKASSEDLDQKKPYKAQKSLTKVAEEKSFWDDQEDNKPKKAIIEEQKNSYKAQKSVSEPEIAEEKSFWDDERDSDKTKKPVVEEVETPKARKGRTSISEVAEEKSFWDDEKDSKKPIIEEVDSPKVRKSRTSITEVAEEKSFWDDDDSSKKPIIEEADSPKIGKSISISEVIEEKSFWDDDKDSKKPIIEEVESRKVKSQKSYTEPEVIEEKSFWDDDEDNKKSKKPIIEEVDKPSALKSQKSITATEIAEEKSIWDDNNNERNKKPIEEDIVTEKKTGQKGSTKPESAEEVSIDENLKSSKRKSIKKESLEEPLSAGIEAPPKLGESTLKDGHAYESLPLVYTVEASGNPKPIVRWLHDGKEVKPCNRVHISNDGNLYKIEIDRVDMKDKGEWQCEISNDLGKEVLKAQLSVSPESELRKPKFTIPLESQRVLQREPVSLKAVCSADPQPHVSWLLNGEEITPDATVITDAQVKDIEHGLKECTFTLNIPTGRHADTGEYTIKATNKYGIGESSARLDILLRPEIEGLKDVTAVPYEETTFIANVRANPIAEVKWSKDGYVIQPSSRHEIIEDVPGETYKLIVKKVGVEDGGVYTIAAKNEVGESTMQAKLIIHTGEPIFTKPLQKETVRDYDDVTLKVRCDGTPKPQVTWYRDGKEIKNDDRHTITTAVGGQVDSELEIKNFTTSDAGKYKVRAANLCGEAFCEAMITLGKTSPGFVHKLDRSREVDEGEPLELKAKLDGSPIPTAKWYKDGVEISPSDSHIKQTSLPDGTIKLNIDHVTPEDCGAYKLIITNPHGDNSALCAVAVNPTPRKPSFSKELEDTKAVVGQPLKLEARVMAFPAPEVKWFKDGQPIRPSQAVSFINQPGGIIGLAIDSCKPEDAGVYSLTVTNKLGEVGSKAKAEVQQKDRKPAFIAELQPAKVIEGFPIKLEVKVLGHPQPAVKWTHNGKEIVPDGTRIKVVSSPDGSHSLLVTSALPSDAGTYAAVASNPGGDSVCEAPLIVASRTDDSSPQERPQLINGLRDVIADEGQPISVSAAFVGNPVPEVSWTKDGEPLKPSERILLTCDGKRVGLEINPVEIPDAGVYGVKLVNPLGEDSSEGKLAVKKVYQPPIFSQKFSDLQQLPKFDAKFPARVSGIPNPDITWYKDGIPLSPSDKYNMKRDGDAVCLYVRDLKPEDAGRYKCEARNREGSVACEANLEVVDKIGKSQKMEPPSFLKKIGDTEVLRGMSAKFTACATGTPDPEVEWFRNDEKLFPCERIRIDTESTGLLRLTISGIDTSDVGTYKCRIYNPYGEDSCTAQLTYDTLEPHSGKRPISDQYSDFDKMKKTGIPMPLADKPIISRMTDRHLTLSWKPSIPHGPRFPVTYQVEMCEAGGEWFTARTGLRSCVCDLRNLKPFVDYKFRVRVENKYGVSEPSPHATTHRAKLEPDPPKFVPYLQPGIDFRPDTSPYFPKDFDIERPPHDGYAQAPRFLRQEHDTQYAVKGHNANLFWFVYGYPKPKMTYFFNDEPIEIGGRYDWSYTRNGQATLFINKMLERDEGWYEAVATNEHGQARQRVRLQCAEYPWFITRPHETIVLQRHTARLEARVGGVPFPDIKWYKDWQPLAASSRIKMQFIEPDLCVLVIHDSILKDEGLYSISLRNVAGSVSSSAMLHIEESQHEYSDRIREHPPRVKPNTKPFGDFFDLGDELGRGVQGVVYHAAERLTGRNYAAKIMHGHSELKPFMKNELEIMNMLNDRHLVRLHSAFEHQHTLALVEELAAGGELVRDRLLRNQSYTERDIAGYIRQLLRGVKYMHDNSVAHLGLTIGELLLSHVGSDELKICDFGLSRRIIAGKHASLAYGMPEYVAPEIASGDGVSFPADMWSIGIITYILLSGHSPFRGANDMETLTRVQSGEWRWHDEEWWSRLSLECRDFISKLLVTSWTSRMDVDAALAHPWLTLADRIYQEEYHISTDRLRNYYNLYRDWTSNAQCRSWFRRRPLSGAFTHPSKMVYPPGEIYTPEGTPERDPHDREPKPWDLQFKQWDHPDWEVSAKSESHYQNGPDTYLLQLRDTSFPVRLREYMKVACHRSPAYNIAVHDAYDPRTPIIRERRRFTDIMDEEIDDERRERINNYGQESFAIRRLRHELGTRLDSYAEAQALMESKREGTLPFFREKPQLLPLKEGEPAKLSCLAVGDPKPAIQWFRNDMVLAEGQRVKIEEDEEGRSTLRFEPAMRHDVGFYKVVARNKVGQTVARTRVVEATAPDAPDSPTAAEVSDTEVLLRWKQPKWDGNSPVLCYGLQYKAGDSVEWKTVAENIDHEFFVIRDLEPDTSYQFRLLSRNRIGWSDKGIPTDLVKTKVAGGPKLEVTKAMRHLQQLTESGREVTLDEDRPKLNYSVEENPIEWSSGELVDRYGFISEIARGRFSTVVKGCDRVTDNVVVAKLLELRPDTEVQVDREFECLRRLRHERIAGLIAAHRLPAKGLAALILERLQGADVLTYLAARHSYSEQTVATIVTQVLDALQYVHWRGYCHLDLQPDNIVMASVRDVHVKLVDFGSAHRVTKLGTSVPQVGHLEYRAPEIITDEPAYPQTDIWSVGVLTYVMLSGVSPYRGEDDAETKQNIAFVRYRFEHLYKEITQEATRFLMFLFKKVPLKRPTAEECHEHRWLTQSDFMNKKRERAVFLGNRLKEFSDEYHESKAREATQAEAAASAFGGSIASPRILARSNSIQEELLTTFASQDIPPPSTR